MDDPRLWAGLGGVGLVLLGAALARWRDWTAMAIPLALLLALTMLLGGIAASPRQMGERLPMLALLLCAPALLATAWPRPWVGWLAVILAAGTGGWWMAGGAAWGPDLERVWPLLVALAAGSLLPAVALERRWQGALLPAALAALLALTAPPGPWAAVALLVALVGGAALAFGPLPPLAARVAMAPMLTALAAGPVIGLDRVEDWLLALALASCALAARLGLVLQAALIALTAAMLVIAPWGS